MKRTSYEDIKNYVEGSGYILDITEEEFVKQNIKVIDKFPMICPKDHNIKMNFHNFKNHGRRCGECAKNKTKSYETIRNDIENMGYKLNTSEIEWDEKNLNTMKKISMFCPIGHKVVKSYNQLRRRGCYECSLNFKKMYSDIKLKIEVDGFTLLTSEVEYKNANLNVRSPLKIKCKDDHILWSNYDNFVNKNKRCRECWLSRNRGPEHPRWNSNKHLFLMLRKSTGTHNFINKHLNIDKNYNNWISDPSRYGVDHIYPVAAFVTFLEENNLIENENVHMYLRENVVNQISNLQLMDRSRNRNKWHKYNKNKFNLYMKENGYLDEIERLKNEI